MSDDRPRYTEKCVAICGIACTRARAILPKSRTVCNIKLTVDLFRALYLIATVRVLMSGPSRATAVPGETSSRGPSVENFFP